MLDHPRDHVRCGDVVGRVETGKEIFAYVVNRTRTGDHYWVLAHVTPSFDAQGQIIGYHSNRRCPSRAAIAKVEPLYRMLSQIEASKSTPHEGMEAAHAELIRILEKDNISYDEFVLSLIKAATLHGGSCCYRWR